MNSDFKKFLSTCPKKNDKYTHVFPKIGSYFVDADKLDEFYNHCNKEFFDNNKTYMCAEKVADTCSFVIDLDFKYKGTYTERQYTQETITELIQLFLKTLDELFNLDQSQYNVWIFEKPNIRECDKVGYDSKDGVHLVFPKIKADKRLYKYFIDLVLQDELLFNEIIEKTSINPADNNIKDIIDSSIYNTNWLIYGSRKTDEENKYSLTRIISINGSQNIVDNSIQPFINNPKSIILSNSVYQSVKNTEYTE